METKGKYSHGGVGADDSTDDASRPSGGEAKGLASGGRPKVASPPRLSRRQVLLGAAGGLILAGAGAAVDYEWPKNSRRAPASTGAKGVLGVSPKLVMRAQVESFVTRPDLRPPKVTISTFGPVLSSPRYIVLSPRTYLSGTDGQHGLMILDRSGRIVWFRPIGAQPFDLQVQSYRSQPVLTWWQGKVVYDYGVGVGEMAGSNYQVLQQIQAGDGLKADLHELQLTSAGTALLTAYEVVEADLSSVGGKSNGKLVVGHAQEIDLATGKVLFDWDSLSHVGIDQSYQAIGRGGEEYDYFHINSIAEMPDGDLLISARGTWALYKVDRSTGRIVWQLGGKRSDFSIGPGAHFYWQHDARPHGPNVISVFDDGAWPPEERQSRGLVLDVDTKAMQVRLRKSYVLASRFLAANQGNVQLLGDGRVFVGWGNQPYFSEFAAGGELLLEGELPFGYHSYRAFSSDWDGTPTERPVAVALANPANGTQVFASWNGATALRSWRVLAGEHPASMVPVGMQAWDGFETSIAVNSSASWFAVVALGPGGKELARSAAVKVRTVARA